MWFQRILEKRLFSDELFHEVAVELFQYEGGSS